MKNKSLYVRITFRKQGNKNVRKRLKSTSTLKYYSKERGKQVIFSINFLIIHAIMFFKPKKFSHLPVQTNQTRRYILPKQTGLAFILVLFFMLIGSVNYNNNLGFVLTFLLSSMAFVSMIHTNRNLSSIKIVSISAKPVFVGETAIIELSVTSESDSRYAVTFHLQGGESGSMDILKSRLTTVRIHIKTNNRGLMDPWPLTIKTEFPFGIFYAFTTLSLARQLVVYPKPIPMDIPMAKAFSGTGDGGTLETTGIDDFKGLKKFQPGDSIKRISWKIFSRGLGVYIKEFMGMNGSRIFIDWDKIKVPDREKKISGLCHMILTASQTGIAFGLRIPGTVIEPSHGEPHRQECLKALALLP